MVTPVDDNQNPCVSEVINRRYVVRGKPLIYLISGNVLNVVSGKTKFDSLRAKIDRFECIIYFFFNLFVLIIVRD